MFWKRFAAPLLLAAAAGVMLIGQPDAGRKLAQANDELDRGINSRAYHIDPAEMLELMWNNQLRLAIIDVRSESDYNLFHLLDARHFTFTKADLLWSEQLPNEAVRVVLSNDETHADEAWKKLKAMGVPNLYILAGGINMWLSLCKPHTVPKIGTKLQPAHVFKPNASQLGDEQLKYTFPAALGDRYPEARPPAECFSVRTHQKKVTVLKPAAAPAGGCGG